MGGLYRIGDGRVIGVVHEFQEVEKHRYFGGADLTGAEETLCVEWRNNHFERVDAKSNERLLYAQSHEPQRIDVRD